MYARSGYEQSKDNLSRVSLATDLVFGDGYDLQVPALGGDATSGYQISLTCAV